MTPSEILALREIQVPLAILGLFLLAALVVKVRHRNAYELIDLQRKMRKEQERRRDVQDR